MPKISSLIQNFSFLSGLQGYFSEKTFVMFFLFLRKLTQKNLFFLYSHQETDRENIFFTKVIFEKYLEK